MGQAVKTSSGTGRNPTQTRSLGGGGMLSTTVPQRAFNSAVSLNSVFDTPKIIGVLHQIYFWLKLTKSQSFLRKNDGTQKRLCVTRHVPWPRIPTRWICDRSDFNTTKKSSQWPEIVLKIARGLYKCPRSCLKWPEASTSVLTLRKSFITTKGF